MMGVHEERKSFFEEYSALAWPYQFHVDLLVNELHGGTPRNPDVVRTWLRAKAGYTDEHEIQAELDRIFALEKLPASEKEAAEAATKNVADRQVNGFKRDAVGLYMEGRHLKACIREAVSVARASDKLPAKYGTTSKGVISFAREHIFVAEDKLPLGRKEHDDMATRFVPTWRGTGITVEEVVYDAKISATVKTDYPFSEKEWAVIWLTAEEGGIGASRSQGYGRFTVTDWYPITESGRKRRTRKP
jgi:hypothetical protein